MISSFYLYLYKQIEHTINYIDILKIIQIYWMNLQISLYGIIRSLIILNNTGWNGVILFSI